MNLKEISLSIKSVDSRLNYKQLDPMHLRSTHEIRNHHSVIKFFINSKSCSFEDHICWFNRYIEDNDQIMWVILLDDQVVGQFGLYNYQIENRSVEFGRLCIHPDFQNMGIAKNTIRSLLNSLESIKGVESVRLEVLVENSIALGLYQSLGFEINDSLTDNRTLKLSLIL